MVRSVPESIQGAGIGAVSVEGAATIGAMVDEVEADAKTIDPSA